MTAIITGTCGTIAYWGGRPAIDSKRAFTKLGEFLKPRDVSFAGLSAFAANSNHAPSDFGGAINWDAGIDLLFRIAGAR